MAEYLCDFIEIHKWITMGFFCVRFDFLWGQKKNKKIFHKIEKQNFPGSALFNNQEYRRSTYFFP